MGLRSRSLVVVSVLAAITWSARATADTSVTLDGNVPADGPDHFFVPFDVPDGTQEIEILHDDKSPDNILDWGVSDPAGWRGWGGGNSENAILNAKAASRSYVPGVITKGTWNVVVGKAKVVVSPAVYHIVVTFRTAPTLAPQTARRPYAAAAALPGLVTGPRYYAGDLHVHSLESGDATPTLDEIGTFARSRGLDFVEISDHNVNTQDDYIADAQSRFADLLFIPGIEYTTYKGHANAIGATKWVDHKIGQPGVTIADAVQQIDAQGAIFSINHPALDIGDLCIGCGWKHDLDPSKVTGVEIETSALSGGGILFQAQAIAFWETFLSKGFHVTGLGGGDDHRAGKESGMFQSALGSPTTMIYASELSAAALMDAIRKGHVVVKTDGPADPMVELTAGDALPGDTLKQRSAVLSAKVTNTNIGQRTVNARWVVNGVPDDTVTVDTEGQLFTRSVQAPPTGEDRYRFEVLLGDNKPHLITNHIFLSLDANGPDPAAQKSSGGCATTRGPEPSNATLWLLFAAAALMTAKRLRPRHA